MSVRLKTAVWTGGRLLGWIGSDEGFEYRVALVCFRYFCFCLYGFVVLTIL